MKNKIRIGKNDKIKMGKTAVIITLILGMLIFVAGCSGNKPNGGAAADFSGEEIKIPLDKITGQLQKFEYDAGGVNVKFFAVRGSDGQVRTAFDACDVCGGYKGYVQQGQDIKCNNCGKVFSIDGLGTKNLGYGCWPSYLSHSIENGNVVISKAELDDGTFRFA